jgi:hypothetical protein
VAALRGLVPSDRDSKACGRLNLRMTGLFI